MDDVYSFERKADATGNDTLYMAWSTETLQLQHQDATYSYFGKNDSLFFRSSADMSKEILILANVRAYRLKQ